METTPSYRWSEDEDEEEDEDDLVCEYDSTWEETGCDSEGKNSRWNTGYRVRRNLQAAKDMQTYRHRYPVKYQPSYFYHRSDLDEEEQMVNLRFYRNEIPSSPDNMKITEFHKHWKGDYDRLEYVHSYIQWLFPLQEAGMNYRAKELTKEEIEEFCKDEEAKKRLVKSYELMLDFYGIRLVDKSTGRVERSEKWEERFDNLNRNTHNNLRITRILKSLGELGFKHYQAPLVKFFLEETLIHNNLKNVKQSVMDYFLFAVRDKDERRKLIEYAFRHYEPKGEFVWCPKKIRLLWEQKDVDEQDQEKGGQSDGSGCDKKNEANLTEDHSETSKAFQCQAPSVDPLQERSSVEQPPPVNKEINQPNLPHSGSLNGDSPLEGHMQGPGVEHSCQTTVSLPLKDLVIQESAQEEGIEAKTESSRVPAEKQSDSDDIKNNSTADDTQAAEQESPPEKQNKKEMMRMAENPNDSDFAEEVPDPARKKDGPSVSSNPVKDDDVTHEIDSENPTAVGGAKESLNSIGEDRESKGTESREPADAAENNLRPIRVNESHQLQAKGVESYKCEGGALESPGPKGGVEDSVSLEGAMDLCKPEDGPIISYLPEGGMSESPRPDVGADEDQRPEGAVEDTASGNDAGNVLSNPDDVKASDDAMKCRDQEMETDEDSEMELQ